MNNKLCEYFHISRNQRKQETGRGLDLMGTRGYETRGCYECDGEKDKKGKCPAFINFRELEDKENKSLASMVR